jgi:hypothetical protein
MVGRVSFKMRAEARSMGERRPFGPERLVVGLLVSSGLRQGAGSGPGEREEIVDELSRRFGAVCFRSPEIDFGWTAYYDAEMGTGIGRFLLAFEPLADPVELAAIKLWTNDLEARHSSGGKRRCNLDPGLLSLGRFVLATTKDRAHRIPLRDGIYAELTLAYADGEYRALPWTYADWGSDEFRGMLGGLRAGLKAELRGLKAELRGLNDEPGRNA